MGSVDHQKFRFSKSCYQWELPGTVTETLRGSAARRLDWTGPSPGRSYCGRAPAGTPARAVEKPNLSRAHWQLSSVTVSEPVR